jgi:hypothetical protein
MCGEIMKTVAMTIPLLPGMTAEVNIKSESREIGSEHLALVARHLDFTIKAWEQKPKSKKPEHETIEPESES